MSVFVIYESLSSSYAQDDIREKIIGSYESIREAVRDFDRRNLLLATKYPKARRNRHNSEDFLSEGYINNNDEYLQLHLKEIKEDAE